ncbi:c-type cytochrome [Roseibium litorale]|uniref:Cytochrome c n=1 Tax=Roseibium litorale TaxID=2803841 RepID=A0ABR9CSE5_9HYPH|nr:cytochrome c [Roseibium litorale]MBD8893564.1 cytochrome c [Roseibium litorale]
MRNWLVHGLAAGFVVVGATSVIAAGDPLETRKTIMDSVAAAAGLGGGMMKGEIAYSPAAGKAAIATMAAASHSFGSFFPAGSDAGDTTASPAIWSDAAGFEAALAKFAATADAAVQASGKDGPADVDAFKAAFGPIMGNCKSCHEAFRVKK